MINRSIRATSILLFASTFTLGASWTPAEPAAPFERSSPNPASCWEELRPDGAESNQEICVDGGEEDLRAAVLAETGKLLWTESGAVPQQKLDDAAALTRSTVTVQATYILGRFWEHENYGGYTKYFSSSIANPCSSDTFYVDRLTSRYWGGSFRVHMNDQIDSVAPGPGCQVHLYVDTNQTGSVYSTTIDRPSISWMHDLASSIKFN